MTSIINGCGAGYAAGRFIGIDVMNDADDLALVSALMETAGLKTSRVAAGTDPRCDLSGNDDTASYLIEVKGLHDPEGIRETLLQGSVFENSRPHHRSSQIGKDVVKATKQLLETPTTTDRVIRIVAIVVRSRYDADIVSIQTVGTLYGIAEILDLADKACKTRPCLYFLHSSFAANPSLDGAVVLCRGATFFLNDHGRQLELARRCGLTGFFAVHGAFYDAQKLQADAGYLISDIGADHHDEDAKKSHLMSKYGLVKPIVLNPKRHSAIVSAIP